MPFDLVASVQRSYPRIYQACHVNHVRSRSTSYRLSAKDSTLLAHLDREGGMTAGQLARHIDISASTLSAAVQRLENLGYLTRTPQPIDRRVVQLRLTSAGEKAMAATSVLDHQRVGEMLAQLTIPERRRAVAGLALLARAADELQVDPSKQITSKP